MLSVLTAQLMAVGCRSSWLGVWRRLPCVCVVEELGRFLACFPDRLFSSPLSYFLPHRPHFPPGTITKLLSVIPIGSSALWSISRHTAEEDHMGGPSDAMNIKNELCTDWTVLNRSCYGCRYAARTLPPTLSQADK